MILRIIVSKFKTLASPSNVTLPLFIPRRPLFPVIDENITGRAKDNSMRISESRRLDRRRGGEKREVYNQRLVALSAIKITSSSPPSCSRSIFSNPRLKGVVSTLFLHGSNNVKSSRARMQKGPNSSSLPPPSRKKLDT